MDRAQQIKKAGIEAGVSAYEKSEDRKIDEAAIQADILREKIKQQAKTLSPGEFVTATMQDVASNQILLDSLLDPYYKDGKRIEGSPSDEQIIRKYAENQYKFYNATEIPSGDAGRELYESLPSGTLVYYNGEFIRKP